MKKNILKTFAIILFFSAVMPLFSGCSDDLDGCGLTVIVKDQQSGERVAGAEITISKEPGNIKQIATSNNHGEAYFFFEHEAIFDIDVKSGIKDGKASANLKFNKVITKEVIIK